MASSLTLNTDIQRFGAALMPTRTFLRQALFALLVLALLPMVAFAQDDDELPIALVFSAQGQAFKEVISGISGDLEEDLKFEVYMIGKTSKVSEIDTQIKKHKPKIIVLVENSSIQLYKKYQKQNPKADFPPSISVAALFVDRFIKGLKNATGIRYEIPAVTSIVNLRQILPNEVKRVGVVHRKWMTGMIEENAKYCRAEGIELVPIELPNKDSNLNKKLKSGLDKLVDNNVDALWVLNDNALLNSNTIRTAWLPTIGKANLPVIVGVRSMLTTKLNFGSFAIVPDHYALGVQAASVIAEIMDEDWEIGERDIEQPLSVKKVVNISVLNNKKVKYREDKLSAMDEVVQ